MHRLTRRLGTSSARRPRLVVAAWLAVVAAVLTLSAVGGGEFVDDFVAPGSQSDRAMTLLEERFPEATGATAMVVFAAPDGETLDQHAATVASTLDRVAQVPRVVSVRDPSRAGTVASDGTIGFAEIAFDAPSSDLGPEPFEALEDAVAPARDTGLVTELGGEAAFLNAEVETSGAEAVGLLVALVVLVVSFGSVVAAVIPVMLAIAAVAMGLGGVALLANAIDVSTSAPTAAAMIGLGVGIDYALFVVARYRENRADRDAADALADAMASSGSAVVFAGGTVVVALSALWLTGVGIMTSMGVAASLVVLLAVAATTTLLPAVLTLLGDRIDRGRVGRRRAARVAHEDSRWWRYAHRIAGRPWPYLLGATALLLLLAAPGLRMETGFPDAGDDPTTTTHRRAYDLLAEGFGPGINGPLLVVADLTTADLGDGGVPALASRLAEDRGIAFTGEPSLDPTGETAVLPAVPTTGPADPRTSDTIERVRATLPAGVHVSGLTALTDDLTAQLDDTLPVFVVAILAASFLLLMLVFRSIAVPLKAALMNLLSIGGAYGVVVAVFQWGWLSDLVGIEGTYAIPSPLPTLMFAVLFGLSMDYEVFLLSRIREERQRVGDDTEAVARGMAATARVITSAALIMVAVFLAFMANPSPFAKMLGLGLATAIALDATIVRMVVVPSAMALMGRANWWLPRWLDRLLPEIGLDEPTVSTATAEPVHVPAVRGPAG